MALGIQEFSVCLTSSQSPGHTESEEGTCHKLRKIINGRSPFLAPKKSLSAPHSVSLGETLQGTRSDHTTKGGFETKSCRKVSSSCPSIQLNCSVQPVCPELRALPDAVPVAPICPSSSAPFLPHVPSHSGNAKTTQTRRNGVQPCL